MNQASPGNTQTRGYYALIHYLCELTKNQNFTLAGALVVSLPDHFWLQQQLDQLDE